MDFSKSPVARRSFVFEEFPSVKSSFAFAKLSRKELTENLKMPPILEASVLKELEMKQKLAQTSRKLSDQTRSPGSVRLNPLNMDALSPRSVEKLQMAASVKRGQELQRYHKRTLTKLDGSNSPSPDLPIKELKGMKRTNSIDFSNSLNAVQLANNGLSTERHHRSNVRKLSPLSLSKSKLDARTRENSPSNFENRLEDSTIGSPHVNYHKLRESLTRNHDRNGAGVSNHKRPHDTKTRQKSRDMSQKTTTHSHHTNVTNGFRSTNASFFNSNYEGLGATTSNHCSSLREPQQLLPFKFTITRSGFDFGDDRCGDGDDSRRLTRRNREIAAGMVGRNFGEIVE
eukprot:CAMPEP_0114976296 /NCGR_PEP_ID=MMETSP0216-20121206/2588_1 /TAXON_ID=223996 /ORGANISM="Protocruzia adherens, Strain Boccale" /LENGTH=342 /DNA_ID=CAMNT_0002337197 /DNA_START=313 /DNA_END=1341 /DNA_ORIENTATION=-